MERIISELFIISARLLTSAPVFAYASSLPWAFSPAPFSIYTSIPFFVSVATASGNKETLVSKEALSIHL